MGTAGRDAMWFSDQGAEGGQTSYFWADLVPAQLQDEIPASRSASGASVCQEGLIISPEPHDTVHRAGLRVR